MATPTAFSETFAQHYRTGKYTDLRLIAGNDTKFDVHKLVVCTQSPILDAKVASGITVINIDADETCVRQLVEWMYGINGKSLQRLLAEGKSAAEADAMGSGIVALSELAKLGEKYQVHQLQDRATSLIGQLAANLTSTLDILSIVYQTTSEGVLGTIQKDLVMRVVHLLETHDSIPPNLTSSVSKRSNVFMPTPHPSYGTASVNSDYQQPVKFNPSATTPARPYTADDTDSDTPLSQLHPAKRKKQRDHDHSPSKPAPKVKAGVNHIAPLPPNRPSPQISNSRQQEAIFASPGPTSRPRRNEPLRISTALPENDPLKGPHCHCKAASSDPTLLPCADCGRKFHPRCVGKGRYAKNTYKSGDVSHMLKDLEAFKDKPFKCGDCEEGFFGGR